ncbi:hypothetical protein [Burkholderia stagnalis]|uniref:hypothetical protein n=1 Tax=Burkholderia stagnalis TaxID=1503054 RepID=UPI000AA90DFA|nr:hypothetical protein [Burkholderia stagnalis]
MSNNVASFDSFESDLQIAAHQAGLIRVILEGQTDVELFSRYWFSSMRDTFEFIDASKLGVGAGCTAVRAAVKKSNEVDSIPAVGILDRDCLFREEAWELLFCIDEAHFYASTRTPNLYVMSLWEVEAYLLDPGLFPHWIFSSHRRPPGTAAEGEAALARVLRECELLLDTNPFFAASHAVGVAHRNSYFRGQPIAKIKATCEQSIAELCENGRIVAKRVQELIEQIRGKLPNEDGTRLTYLLRYVDTKRLLIRLFEALRVKDDTHWMLPPLQLAASRRPEELEKILKEVGEKFAI